MKEQNLKMTHSIKFLREEQFLINLKFSISQSENDAYANQNRGYTILKAT